MTASMTSSMISPNRFARIAVRTALIILGVLLVSSAQDLSAQSKTSRFQQWLQAFASAGSGSVSGNWHGTKVENDPLHGGYITINFVFAFSPEGTYQEAAFLGSRRVMVATGTYQQNGNRLAFNPDQCSFDSPDLAQVVKFFPIPTDSAAEDVIGFSPLEGGSQMSLKDTASGEDWGLKPAR
jgi:hypothetical protein